MIMTFHAGLISQAAFFRRLSLATAALGALAFGMGSYVPVAMSAAPAEDTSAIEDGDPVALAKELGLIESAKPARELVKGWTKPKKIMVRVDNNVNRVAWLQKAVPGVTIVPVKNLQEAQAKAADVDAIVGFCGPDSLVKAAKNLKWMQGANSGVEECVYLDDIQNGKVTLSNRQKVTGQALASHAIAMMMTLSRALDLYARQNQAEHFDRALIPADRIWEIQGRTLLVVGLGGTGGNVAKMAHGLGMKVIATRGSSRERPEYVDYVGLSDELPNLIGQADVVIMAAPLTKETTNLFDKAMFARMKQGALFINIGRGKEVVTDDLIAALNSGHLSGAGVDNTEPEPLPDHHPLFKAKNALITPHMGSSAAGAGTTGPDYWVFLREQMRRYAAGDKLYSVVDAKRGY